MTPSNCLYSSQSTPSVHMCMDLILFSMLKTWKLSMKGETTGSYLESRTPSWAGLWALSYMPSIWK